MAIGGQQLRIAPAAAPAGDNPALRDAGAPVQRGAISLDNILKLIPGEVVPLYITGSGIAFEAGAWKLPWLQVPAWPAAVFGICMLICIFLRATASSSAGAANFVTGANVSLVLVSGAAFFLWAHAISEAGPIIDVLPKAVWGFFAMAFSVVAPLLVRGEGPQVEPASRTLAT